ncbi:MAG TPA: hypothetical protein VFV34_20325 [Blastocatellia bacterium]|nr:hypothetical protein [Blastocatellia bacterium]
MPKQRLFPDTDEATEGGLIEVARGTPAWKKVKQIADAAETTRTLALAGLKSRYPQATSEEVRNRRAALILDLETVRTVYGWDPEREGY